MASIEKQTCILSVYNTLTGKIEEVEVPQEVYHACRRSAWNIDDNNKSFYAHEIQLSGLIGGEDGAYENFREFIDTENTPDSIVPEQLQTEELRRILTQLSESDRQLIQAFFFEGLTEQKYADQLGVAQQVINRKKHRILKKLKKLLSEGV